MRRKLAVAMLAAGMFAAAGCGGDGGGDEARSTEEICEEISATVDPLEEELSSALFEAGSAAAGEDEAVRADAMAELDELVGEFTGAVRDGAADAEDAEFSQALNDYADEVEDLIAQIAGGEAQPDMSGLDAANGQVEQYCGE